MTIILRVDNFDVMPHGGPILYQADRRDFAFGRDARLDWSLGDPSRHISGKHCEIRFENDCYMLYDVSTNGTFINGGERVTSPYGLKDGDRLTVGQYRISVRISDLQTVAGTEVPAGNMEPGSKSEPFASDGVASDDPTAPAPAPGMEFAGFVEMFARGADMDPADLEHVVPSDLAEEVGAVMRIVVEHLAVLMAARAKTKMITKSANRTTLAAEDNNPIKFLRTPDEMLTALFARSRRGFKDARGSVGEAFADLEKHELATASAMQEALTSLLEDISPDAIESDVARSVFSSRQARAWDLFVERWRAKSEPHDNNILDAFLEQFSKFYDARNDT